LDDRRGGRCGASACSRKRIIDLCRPWVTDVLSNGRRTK
jgi:hypothetical protein